ncbi:MAG: 50S ribosomal protein L18 [Planctomycetota bacterium]|nr:MAG: 50S ribosomal protein L18 [Planctomycetota bacterium]
MDHLQQKKKWKRRLRKQLGIRRRLALVSDRPRLSVYRSHKHISAQIIDDQAGRTLASASTYEKELLGGLEQQDKTSCASAVGAKVAERALAAGVQEVVFDRSYYLYHGRVKALAEAARKGGLKF